MRMMGNVNESTLKMLNRRDNGEDGKTRHKGRPCISYSLTTIINLTRTSTLPKTDGSLWSSDGWLLLLYCVQTFISAGQQTIWTCPSLTFLYQSTKIKSAAGEWRRKRRRREESFLFPPPFPSPFPRSTFYLSRLIEESETWTSPQTIQRSNRVI